VAQIAHPTVFGAFGYPAVFALLFPASLIQAAYKLSPVATVSL
jgi:hypothetical protein